MRSTREVIIIRVANDHSSIRIRIGRDYTYLRFWTRYMRDFNVDSCHDRKSNNRISNKCN
jgi:hypothetical protein